MSEYNTSDTVFPMTCPNVMVTPSADSDPIRILCEPAGREWICYVVVYAEHAIYVVERQHQHLVCGCEQKHCPHIALAQRAVTVLEQQIFYCQKHISQWDDGADRNDEKNYLAAILAGEKELIA